MPAPYPALTLCFDGTWNSWKCQTNVSRLYAQIADVATGTPGQRKFYDEGVGTKKWQRIRGGTFGIGLDENIRQGYAWLSTMYRCEKDQPPTPPANVVVGAGRQANGDLVETPKPSGGSSFIIGSDIYLFGFSRGAFTARSLAGMVNLLGIPTLDPTRAPTSQTQLRDDDQIIEAWNLYVNRPAKSITDAIAAGTADPKTIEEVKKFHTDVSAFRARPSTRYPVRIHFLGVWDTVGALGVPRIFDYKWIPRFSTKYQFHDTSLGEAVRNAFHAVAIDENRLPFRATLWEAKKPTTERIEQRWFPGAHANVGGGYEKDLLHVPPLYWLATKAAACGLEFLNDRQVKDPKEVILASVPMPPAAFDVDGTEYLSPVRDSYKEMRGYSFVRDMPFMGGRVYRRMLVEEDGIAQTVDESAFAKWRADVEYRPPNLGQAGRTDVSFNVAADFEAAGTLLVLGTNT